MTEQPVQPQTDVQEFHVFNKSQGHLLSDICWCEPTLMITLDNGNEVWQHHNDGLAEQTPYLLARAIKQAWSENE